MHHLFKNVKLQRACTEIAAGSTVYEGLVVDTRGYRGVAAIAALGTMTTLAVGNLHIEGANTSATSDMVDMEDSAVAFPVSGAADLLHGTVLICDIGRPKYRFYRPVVYRATANSAINGMFMALYNPVQAAVSQSTAAESLVMGSTFLVEATTGASTGS
jgi:hypothetical protein